MRKITFVFVMAILSLTISAQTVLFEDNFDDGIATLRWNVDSTGSSNTFNMAYDYADDILAAPNGGGLGFKIEVNTSTGESSQVSAFPADQVFTSSNYTISFDCWMNFTIGGSGTTEFAIWGVKQTDELVPNNTGMELAVTGDSGSSKDVRLYVEGNGVGIDVTVDPDTTNVYLAGSQNINGISFYDDYDKGDDGWFIGREWLEVDIKVTSDSVFYYVNDLLWVKALDTIADGSMSIGYADWFTSSVVTDGTNWIIYDNVVVTDNTVGINNTQLEQVVSLYPNPAKDILNVTVEERSTLELINTVGQVVYSSVIEGTSTIDIANLTNGMYIAKVTNGNGQAQIHKVIVN